MSTGTLSGADLRGSWFETQQLARPKTAPTKLSRMALPICLFIVLLCQLWIRVSIIDAGYRLEASRNAALENDERLRAVRLDWAMQTRPGALRSAAHTRLKMVPLIPQHIRKISLSQETV